VRIFDKTPRDHLRDFCGLSLFKIGRTHDHNSDFMSPASRKCSIGATNTCLNQASERPHTL
jgi:hypothetical protein